MGRRTFGRAAGALVAFSVVWFPLHVLVASAAINYDEHLAYRLNLLGRSYPPWPRWEPWWGWYLMHAGLAGAGLAAAARAWRSARLVADAEPGAAADGPKAGRR